MNAFSSLRTLLVSLLLAGTAAQAQLTPAPIPTPPAQRFLESVSVTLAPGGLPVDPLTRIVFDTVDPGSTAPWDSLAAEDYAEGIKISSTKRLRAQSYIDVAGVRVYSALGEHLYVRDRPPSVAVASPAPGAVLRRTTAYALVAQASDPDLEAVTVTFQYRLDQGPAWTTIGTAVAAPYTVNWTPAVGARHWLRARAEAFGATVYSESLYVTVTEPNMPPTDVVLTSPADGASFASGQDIPLAATARDMDPLGGAISRIEFYHDDTLIAAVAGAQAFSATWRNGPPGEHALRARAYDNHTPPASAASPEVRVTIRPPNARPVVTGLTATPPGPLAALATTTLNAAAEDADGRVARVAFYDNGTLLGQDTSHPYAWQASGLGAGTHAFTARAYDETGDSSVLSAETRVSVLANQPPIASAGRDTFVVQPANTVPLDGSGSGDPENAGLVYLWSAPAGSGVSFSNAAIARPTATLTIPGAHVLTLTVTDRNTPPASATDQVVVSLRARPVVTGRLVDTATVGTPYTYTLAATGFPAPTISVGTLPAGITRSENTLAGTPAGPGGAAAITLTAANEAGTDTRTLNLTVRQAPAISQNLPESHTVQERGRVTLTIAASGYPPPAFQWQKVPAVGNPVNVGGNSSTLVLDTVSPSAAGDYRVVVSNGVGSPAVSRVCRLAVAAMIRIHAQPLSIPLPVVVGRPAVFQVRATGAPPLQYQWFRGATSLGVPSAADSNLILPAVRLPDSGLYRVRITNPWNDSARGVWSDTARLSVARPRIDVPKASPPAPAEYGRNQESLVVTLSTDTPGTVIRYAVDGSAPTASTGILYDSASKPTFRGTNVTLRARAFRDGYQESDLFVGTYAYVKPGVASKPAAWPLASVFLPTQTVSCTLKAASPPGAAIRYTLNGADPRTSAYLEYAGPFPLTRTVTVTAYAVGAAGFLDSDTLVKTYVLETPRPRARIPEATPRGQSFSGRLSVSLASATDSAAILYTLDGSPPESSPTRNVYDRTQPIPISARTVLKAVATAPGHLPSEVLTETYVLIPGPITATPAPVGGNHVFKDSVRVRLAVTPDVPIYYTLNDSLPLDLQNRPTAQALLYTADGIPLADSRTVTAVALADGSVPGNLHRFSYTRAGGALNTPVVSTPGGAFAFKDSLRVTLSATAGAAIRYTRDGSLPGASSPAYQGPFTVDTTLTLRAIALQDSFLPSRVLTAVFTLEADTPRAAPRGGSYFSGQNVRLSARSRKTPIKYTLDGSMPGPGHGTDYLPGQIIPIAASTDLKAVALAGGVPGPLLEEAYRINRTLDTVLLPGVSCFLEGGISLANPAASAAAVKVTQGAADALDLRGFEGVQSRITLAAAAPAAGSAPPFPGVVLTRSASESRGLYKAHPDGRVYFVSSAARIDIAEPGTYFMGRDVARPAVTLLEERVDDSGTTVVRIRLEDNVQNLLLSVKRNDSAAEPAYEPASAGTEKAYRLRHGKGVLKPLLLQVTATDYANDGSLPADGRSFLPLSQALADVRSGDVWRVGSNAARPHDLVGVPFHLAPPLAVEDLADAGSGPVDAFVFENASNDFRRLARKDTLVPGQAYWLASRSRLAGFRRAAARLRGPGTETFAVRLVPGWNQVANPHLDTLYWPAPSRLGDAYQSSRVKRLWEYAPVGDSVRYLEREAMEPWKGYYVYNYAGDTLVRLHARPAAPDGFAPKRAADSHAASLLLGYGDAPAVTLAASPASLDEPGWEDERLLPAFATRHRIKAVRRGNALSCDWIRFRQDAPLRWNVLARSPGGAPSGAPGGADLPDVRVLARALPEGYEAWAVSRKRGMKFPLETGRAIPASGIADDTLEVIAGPAALLAGLDLLAGLSLDPPPLSLRVRAAPGGPELLLDLPGRSRVRASLWTLRGTCLGELGRDLPAGHHRFRFAEDFRRRVAGPAAGVHFLRVEIAAPGARPAFLVRKVFLRD